MRKLFITLSVISLMTFAGAAMLYAQNEEPRSKEDLIADITAASEPQMLMSRLSEDLRWDYQVMRYDCTPVDPGGGMSVTEMAYETLTVQDRENEASEPYLIADQVIQCQGLGAFGLATLYVSENSRYLYYTDAREGEPDGGISGWLPTIYRFHTADMGSVTLGGGVFSTWRDKLITREPNLPGQPPQPQIHLYDTNEVKPLASYDITGEIVWLPGDNDALIIEGDYHLGDYAIVHHIDVETLKRTTLLETGTVPEATAETD